MEDIFVLEIIVEPQRTINLRHAISEAIKTGDYDSLFDDIRDCFTDDQVEYIEDLLESSDIGEAIDDIVEEWNAEDMDELFEVIEHYFADLTVDLQFVYDEDLDIEEETLVPPDFEDDLLEAEDDESGVSEDMNS
jgi:predicted house-cleaning noncanonical NTP pyrophosphatase (MazG superfamily)